MYKPFKRQLRVETLFNIVKENQFPLLLYLPIITKNK